MFLARTCRHKEAHKEGTEQKKGKMRINNGFLESMVKHVTVVVTGSTPAKEIVQQALIRFDMVVSLFDKTLFMQRLPFAVTWITYFTVLPLKGLHYLLCTQMGLKMFSIESRLDTSLISPHHVSLADVEASS